MVERRHRAVGDGVLGRGMRARALRRAITGAALLLALLPATLSAQADDIAASKKRLQEIQREKVRLREEMNRIRSRVTEVSSEVENLERQVSTSQRLLSELEAQAQGTEAQIAATTSELQDARDRLAQRKSVLDRRLREIYKRGALHGAEVLLTAASFGDLIHRYKYLYLIAQHDRGVVRDVQRLERQLLFRERRLARGLQELTYLRQQKESEFQELADLERRQRQILSTVKRTQQTTAGRLEQLVRDEKQLAALLATLEKRRKEAERLAAERRRKEAAAAAARGAKPAPTTSTPAASTLSTRDIGALGWPVEGSLLYRFGRATQPNGGTIRYNGVGIAAAAGSPVKSVEAGKVVLASSFEGYGPTVVLDHGAGYYTLYLYLREVSVREGASVAKGQVVGTVGGDPARGQSHIEFQVRSPGGQAVDPLTWLRKRAG